MGQIGRFIDKACAAHPVLMVRVLARPFGTLRDWVSFDEEGEACGCLIGTMALCAGYDASKVGDGNDDSIEHASTWAARVIWPAAQEGSPEDDAAFYAGMAVYEMSKKLSGIPQEFRFGAKASQEAEALTAELIKRRIARRLGVTNARPVVEVQHA
jgi:hypothetical protein